MKPAAAPVFATDKVAAAPRAATETVHWTIETKPTGASVVRADTGEILGTTPFSMDSSKQNGELEVRLLHPGFAEQRLRLDSKKSMSQEVRLRRAPRSFASPERHSKEITNDGSAKPAFRVIE
jgi:serine/threonine-protein kinase